MKRRSRDEDLRNLNSIYGALFFAVPSQGMETEHLFEWLQGKPQAHQADYLNHNTGHSYRWDVQKEFCNAFPYRDSKIVQFYELDKSPILKLVSNPAKLAF